MTDQAQTKPNELNEEQAKLAEERMKNFLCPVCGLPMPWECRGPLNHMRAGGKKQ